MACRFDLRLVALRCLTMPFFFAGQPLVLLESTHLAIPCMVSQAKDTFCTAYQIILFICCSPSTFCPLRPRDPHLDTVEVSFPRAFPWSLAPAKRKQVMLPSRWSGLGGRELNPVSEPQASALFHLYCGLFLLEIVIL